MSPLHGRELGASLGEPWFHEVSDGEINIVATQQDMFAHSHTPNVGDRAWLIQVQLEQAKIGGTAPNIDHQRVVRPGVRLVEALP